MKTIKKIVAGVLTAVVSLVGLVGCTDKQAGLEYDEYKGNVNNVIEVPVDEEKPSVADFDGQIVRTGGAYNFSKNMAFLGSDLVRTTSTTATEETFTESSVTVTATVYPADANQNVDWRVEFMNASSTWATGKSVTDYVSVTTETAGSTTATVTCKRPFAEQIKLVCTSQENAEISDYRTVDFVQAVKSVSLTFGDDLPINFGGETAVSWELNENGIGMGGDANVQIEMYEDYTLSDNTYAWDIDLISPQYYYDGTDDADMFADGYLVFENGPGLYSYTDHVEDLEVVVTTIDCMCYPFEDITSLVFDRSLLTTFRVFCFRRYTSSTAYTTTSILTLIRAGAGEDATDEAYYAYSEGYFSCITENTLWTLRLTVAGEKNTYEDTSLIKVGKFTNNPLVKSVTLSDNVKF